MYVGVWVWVCVGVCVCVLLLLCVCVSVRNQLHQARIYEILINNIYAIVVSTTLNTHSLCQACANLCHPRRLALIETSMEFTETLVAAFFRVNLQPHLQGERNPDHTVRSSPGSEVDVRYLDIDDVKSLMCESESQVSF
jgi:hypothetical protein